jgi:hypothetical protein
VESIVQLGSMTKRGKGKSVVAPQLPPAAEAAQPARQRSGYRWTETFPPAPPPCDGSLEERIGYRFKDAALLDSALLAHLLAQGRPQPMPTASSRTGSAPRLIRRFRDASAASPPEPGWALAESALSRSCIGAPNRAQHRFNVSRVGAARHPHPDGSDHEAKFA